MWGTCVELHWAQQNERELMEMVRGKIERDEAVTAAVQRGFSRDQTQNARGHQIRIHYGR